MTNYHFFKVSYETAALESDFSTEFLRNEAAIRNAWGDANTVEGVSGKNNVTYLSNCPIVGNCSVNVPAGDYIVYNDNSVSLLDIDEYSFTVLSTQLFDATSKPIYRADGRNEDNEQLVKYLVFESGRFSYTIKDSDGAASVWRFPTNAPSENVWYIIILAPYAHSDYKLKVIEYIRIGGTMPNSDTYPSTNLYPYIGEWEKNTEGDA